MPMPARHLHQGRTALDARPRSSIQMAKLKTLDVQGLNKRTKQLDVSMGRD
jgi:hypothetical protein